MASSPLRGAKAVSGYIELHEEVQTRDGGEWQRQVQEWESGEWARGFETTEQMVQVD